jgi:hypothetical protein
VGELGRELRADAISLAILGAIVYVLYRKLTGDATAAIAALPSIDTVTGAAADIVNNAPSALVDLVEGNNDSTYITREQQQVQAQEALAAHMAAKQLAIASQGE